MPRNWQSGRPRKRTKKSKCKKAEWKKKKEALLEASRTNHLDVFQDEWQDRNVSPQPGPSGLHNKMNHSHTSLF
ncbi:unnamed protein product, partial [Timema podura]|nr:unnamed protein product [Timema podura]